MNITREADYALRITVLLAQIGRQVEAKIISEKSGVPYRFTLKILRKLVMADIVKSFRGVNGGYTLKKEPDDITFFDVIDTLDGPLAINRCLKEEDICENSGICAIQHKLIHIQDIMVQEMKKCRISDILESGEASDCCCNEGS